MDPLHIFAFTVAHIVMIIIALGFIVPRSLDIFIPPERRHNNQSMYAPQVVIPSDARQHEGVEEGVNEDGLHEEDSREKVGKDRSL